MPSRYPLSSQVVHIPSGLEHVEFAIGDGKCKSPINSRESQHHLKSWMEQYPSVPWKIKALDKQCNHGGKKSAKFHLMPLEDVIKFELGKQIG
mmetsp:Transcript_14579/g.35127  ORF Transcript_14579/g.35127 Transcript_14579/m.35127 type:complete len:93 (-) Transcript_14579:30-308(-)